MSAPPWPVVLLLYHGGAPVFVKIGRENKFFSNQIRKAPPGGGAGKLKI